MESTDIRCLDCIYHVDDLARGAYRVISTKDLHKRVTSFNLQSSVTFTTSTYYWLASLDKSNKTIK